ncbi:MAG: twin-arginine translocation pathway signal [Cytophagales bacterium CG18_big_fil_WC_8_21_14_2_50_42_9]|nr:MAG: twin-arginine translocation pathway signal [Cytophagales bacterium CG18_big_fil_WC_8_21_14_2_50_42_9]
MDRREAVLKITGLLGITLSAPLLAGLLTSCDAQQKKDKKANGPLVVSAKHQELISQIAEIIIPDTSTPGAKAAKVPAFILLMLADCYTYSQQEAFFAGLDALDATAKEKYGTGFLACSPQNQEALVVQEENKTLALAKEQPQSADKDILPFFSIIKELTLVGYFTSEIGATQALQYVAVPGEFHGSVPLQPGQKAWAIS